MTLTHGASTEDQARRVKTTDTSIVMRREDGPDIAKKGPWRMKYVGAGKEPAPPRSFLLLYNTDLQKDAEATVATEIDARLVTLTGDAALPELT